MKKKVFIKLQGQLANIVDQLFSHSIDSRHASNDLVAINKKFNKFTKSIFYKKTISNIRKKIDFVAFNLQFNSSYTQKEAYLALKPLCMHLSKYTHMSSRELDNDTNKSNNKHTKKSLTNTDYRKFVAWHLVLLGLKVAYEKLSAYQGLRDAYHFILAYAPDVKPRFYEKAHEQNINVGMYDINEKISRVSVITVCQIVGLDTWNMFSPHDSDYNLLKPYQPFRNEIMSIII